MPKKNFPIESFVFFDIETTGLPREEKNNTKIIEYSFLAVLRKDLECTHYGETPEIFNKLTSVLNPEKTVCRVVTQMTGLTRKKLSKAPKFGEKFQSIKAFLEDLPKPVCLLSHNGNSFDFKILLAECNDVSASLPADLLCVDTLIGFRTLLMGTGINYSHLDGSYSMPKPSADQSPSSGSKTLIANDSNALSITDTMLNEQSALKVANTASELSNEPNPTPENIETEFPDIIISAEAEGVLEEIVIDNTDTIFPDSDTENQDRNILNTQINNVAKKQQIPVQNTSTDTERECFKLTSVYKRLLNREEENAHRAEGDCLMLLRSVAALKKYFLPWADKNYQLLTKIRPIIRGQTWRRRGYYRRFRY